MSVSLRFQLLELLGLERSAMGDRVKFAIGDVLVRRVNLLEVEGTLRNQLENDSMIKLIMKIMKFLNKGGELHLKKNDLNLFKQYVKGTDGPQTSSITT
jgi:hypothetical protein